MYYTAKENPDSRVYGMDLSAIQPEKHGAPNCSFEVDDAEEEWTGYPTFDYVHLRSVFACFYNPKLVLEHACKYWKRAASRFGSSNIPPNTHTMGINKKLTL